ncbi:MAG TPA: gluconate 2-dehydrogenase subunit 3 family protein [Gammaproteobacteria bacterium]
MSTHDRSATSAAPAETPARTITRREAVARAAQLLGGAALVGGTRLLTACAGMPDRAAAAGGVGPFTAADVAFLDEIAETILPATSTPGAKAAQTGAFMALMATDAYSPRQRRIFRSGMRRIERACRRMHGVGFMEATPAQRLAVLAPLDAEQKALADAQEAAWHERLRATLAAPPAAAQTRERAREAAGPSARRPHYFRMMKELALLGYFTSEIGYTQAMRYVESPGRFDPCVPYHEGEPIWASHA